VDHKEQQMKGLLSWYIYIYIKQYVRNGYGGEIEIDGSEWKKDYHRNWGAGLKLKLMPEMRKRPRIKKTKSERRRFQPFSQRSMIKRSLLLCSSTEFQRQRVTLIRFIASFFFCLQSSTFWHFRWQKTTSFNDSENKKKLTGSHPGLAGWTGSRVDRVSPGQFPSGFLPQPGPVPGPGRPGPGSTRRAGPGFKTLLHAAAESLFLKSLTHLSL